MKKAKEFNLKQFITWTLRKATYRTKARRDALRAARVERNTYKCAACQKLFPNKEVRLDHIEPCINPETGFTTWDDYIARMFCGPEGLQVLCLEDHKAKTKAENARRSEVKGANNATA